MPWFNKDWIFVSANETQINLLDYLRAPKLLKTRASDVNAMSQTQSFHFVGRINTPQDCLYIIVG